MQAHAASDSRWPVKACATPSDHLCDMQASGSKKPGSKISRVLESPIGKPWEPKNAFLEDVPFGFSRKQGRVEGKR